MTIRICCSCRSLNAKQSSGLQDRVHRRGLAPTARNYASYDECRSSLIRLRGYFLPDRQSKVGKCQQSILCHCDSDLALAPMACEWRKDVQHLWCFTLRSSSNAGT